ncbi:hypothetical protein CYLTODRAFT_418696 [Cylindrobasidium torrendii FP15055 ss-10]|uniref:TECPR1-like DysF domain-containing protein n=1 Tax=Cylindrobasidium torrendii FP15055 ss-10 TaxID=1314674 RepID=A0A0D7BN76_9AGAR|nr:hypothetical protein CYLTODRAFT_418696 [Cylindrobasidium torrendii FP15055 ss-10]
MTQAPELLVSDEYSAADAARARFAKQSRFAVSMQSIRSAFSASSSKKLLKTPRPPPPAPAEEGVGPASREQRLSELSIRLARRGTSGLSEFHQDQFRWAVLYENQRGLTLFSTAYYSHLSLLPGLDPYAYTIPSTSGKRSKQPNYTPKDYPLPDGNWRWVSNVWMIDMQNDGGHVQHDGFEYNWFFRRHHWRAQVGNLSAGGFVRRRRWIRLMMRPSKIYREKDDTDTETLNSELLDALLDELEQNPTPNASRPVSTADLQEEQLERVLNEVWFGDDGWRAYSAVMKHAGRDGRKLELWRTWLGVERSARNSPVEPAVTLNGSPAMPNSPSSSLLSSPGSRSLRRHTMAPPRDRIESLLKQHGDDILHGFIYPDSRAQFVVMLKHAELLDALKSNEKIAQSPSLIHDFWSYTKDL